MTPIQPPQPGGDFGEYDGEFEGETGHPGGRRTLVRYGVPVAIAGVAAATIGLGTALATTGGSPSLPHLTAAQLLTRMAQSRVQTVSGTVRVTTDLGLPAGLDGALPGAGALAGPGRAGGGASADPQTKLTELLAGTHTLRVAADGPQRQRISLLDSTSEYSVIHNGDQLWAYDSAANAVFHATRPAGAPHGKAAVPAKPGAKPDHALPATPQDAVQQALKAVDPTTSVTVDGTARVAGRAAYELVIAPKQAGSTVGSIRVAVDAANGTPLAFTLTPKGSGTAAVDIAYTSVDFGTPAASTFTFTVPKGAKVTQGTDAPSAGLPDLGLSVDRSGARTLGSGWTSVLEMKQSAGPAAGPKSGAIKNGAVMNGPMKGAPRNGGAGAQSLPSLLGSLGHQVHGAFGSGTVISTRLVNVLITDKGTVFAGAVTESGLIRAADSAAAR